jgi:hypothetical protein
MTRSEETKLGKLRLRVQKYERIELSKIVNQLKESIKQDELRYEKLIKIKEHYDFTSKCI